MTRRDEESLIITSAPRSRNEDISGRTRRYLIAMSIRGLCFILAVVFLGHALMWVFLAGAVFLPYFAVVMANSTGNPGSERNDHAYSPGVKAITDQPSIDRKAS